MRKRMACVPWRQALLVVVVLSALALAGGASWRPFNLSDLFGLL
jgi:hypothetical protein